SAPSVSERAVERVGNGLAMGLAPHGHGARRPARALAPVSPPQGRAAPIGVSAGARLRAKLSTVFDRSRQSVYSWSRLVSVAPPARRAIRRMIHRLSQL